MKDGLQRETQDLFRTLLMEINSMNEEQAKAVVLCLFRMSFKPATLVGCQEENLTYVLARVKARHQIFQQEQEAIQTQINWTLVLLVYRLAKHLQLENSIRYYSYRLRGIGWLKLEAFHRTSSETLSKTLLAAVIFYDVQSALRLGEAPVNQSAWIVQQSIKLVVEHKLWQRLSAFNAVVSVPEIMQVGSLWSTRIGFPVLGWVKRSAASVEEVFERPSSSVEHYDPYSMLA